MMRSVRRDTRIAVAAGVSDEFIGVMSAARRRPCLTHRDARPFVLACARAAAHHSRRRPPRDRAALGLQVGNGVALAVRRTPAMFALDPRPDRPRGGPPSLSSRRIGSMQFAHPAEQSQRERTP